MGSSLTLLYHSGIFVTDISYNSLYWHDLYSAVSDIYFMISLYVYSILCMTRCLALEHQCPFQYSYVYSSMMSVHPKGGGSARDTRVSFLLQRWCLG